MRYFKIRDVKSPVRGTQLSAGIDFFVPNDFKATTLRPGESISIPSGLKVKIPDLVALVAFNKSGVALKKKLVVGACVVDADYQGEVHLHVMNVGDLDVNISPGEKLVQFLMVHVALHTPVPANSLEDLYPEDSERGEGGFGSTGTR